jgi:hypothetical protein
MNIMKKFLLSAVTYTVLIGNSSCQVEQNRPSLERVALNEFSSNVEKLHSYAWTLDSLWISKNGIRGFTKKMNETSYNLGAQNIRENKKDKHLFLQVEKTLYKDLESDGILDEIVYTHNKNDLRSIPLNNHHQKEYERHASLLEEYLTANIEREREIYKIRREKMGLAHLDKELGGIKKKKEKRIIYGYLRWGIPPPSNNKKK